VEVQTQFLNVAQADLVVLSLRDISAEKRRGVLERAFFHDVLNLVAGVRAIAELLNEQATSPAQEEEYRQSLRLLSRQLSEEITAQRQLVAAERGELTLNLATVAVPELLESVAELYRNHDVARGRTLQVQTCPECSVETDATLLRRVLGNLVKNALEASAVGETVNLEAVEEGETVVFTVRNPGVIPQDVQKQIFQRSFSTKGELGRGIGTHSVKLLGERYLGGQVSFTSRAPEGTAFTVRLPWRIRTDRSGGAGPPL